MARSRYVYVVSHADGTIGAAFTVKHELVSWLRGWMPMHMDRFRIVRIPDGRDGGPVNLDALSLMSGG